MVEGRARKNWLSPERLLLLGCAAAFSVANIDGWLVPQIVSGAMEKFQVSSAAAGLVATVPLLLIAAGATLLAAKPPKISLRLLALISGLLALALNVLSSFAPTFPVLLVLRGLAGLSVGVLLFCASAPVAGVANPDRGYALINGASTAVGSIALLTIPFLFPTAEGLDYLRYAGLSLLVIIPLFFWIPHVPTRNTGSTETLALSGRTEFRVSGAAVALFLAVAITTIQSFAIITLSVRIGEGLGASGDVVSRALGFGGAVAIPATLAAGLVSSSRRWLPVICALALAGTASSLSAYTSSVLIFTLCLMAVIASAYFLLPLYLGYAASLDPTGRIGGMTMAVFIAASATAPTLAGLFADSLGLHGLGTIAIPLYATAIIFITLTERAVRRSGVDMTMDPGDCGDTLAAASASACGLDRTP